VIRTPENIYFPLWTRILLDLLSYFRGAQHGGEAGNMGGKSWKEPIWK
jgi:hypothetical protein